MAELKKSIVAERAIQRAIAEGTAELEANLRAANTRIAQLERTLADISRIADAMRGLSMPVTQVPLPPELAAMLNQEPAPIPAPDGVRYAEDDDNTDGRWV